MIRGCRNDRILVIKLDNGQTRLKVVHRRFYGHSEQYYGNKYMNFGQITNKTLEDSNDSSRPTQDDTSAVDSCK